MNAPYMPSFEDDFIAIAEHEVVAVAHPAIAFLNALDSSPNAHFCIETYSDMPKGREKPKPDKLKGRYCDLSVTEVGMMLPRLAKINKSGAGIFVAVNQFRGHRSKNNLDRIRGCHADFDSATDEQIKAVRQLLQPTIDVQSSSATKRHLYWLLSAGEQLNTAEAESMHRMLVKMGADPAAIDVSRLLRLPGFLHMKYREESITPTVMASFSGCHYTAENLRQAFLTVLGVSSDTSPKAETGLGLSVMPLIQSSVTSASDTVIAALANQVCIKQSALWYGDWESVRSLSKSAGYGSQSEADLALAGHIARACRRAGIPEAEVKSATDAVFSRSALADRQKWNDRPDYRERTLSMAVSSSVVSANAAPLIQLESYGDIRNSRAFANRWRDQLLYVATRDRWLRWEEERLQLCEKEEHLGYAKSLCADFMTAATAVFNQDPDKGKRLLQDAIAAHNLPKITAMLKLAVSEPGMAVTDRELDADPYLLGLQNGVVNLRTGDLLINRPELLITRFCNASYVEAAPCTRWLAFLTEVFESDMETIESVQRLLGYSLTGLVTEEVLVICCGYGSNGKSVFNNVVHRIFGGYARTAPPSLLTVRRPDDSGPRNDLAMIAGARYVSINELQAGDRLDEQTVKLLAGREPISARFLYQELFEYMPTFTAWMRTNHKPIITGEDDGIWRRLVILPFKRKFIDEKKDPHLEEKLMTEADGILQWMLEGARKYFKDGLQLSKTIKAEHASYRKESDMLGEFLEDQTEIAIDTKESQSGLFSRWRYWCEVNGVRHGSKKTFTQRLAERGFTEARSNGGRYYTGLKLKSPSISQGG